MGNQTNTNRLTIIDGRCFFFYFGCCLREVNHAAGPGCAPKGLWSLDVDVVLILTSTKSEMFRIYLTNRLLRKSRYAHAHKAQLSNVLVRSFFDVAGTEIQVK